MADLSMSKLDYYLRSIPTLLGGIANWPVLPALALGKSGSVLRLNNGVHFEVRTLMDAWVIKETCLDKDYETNGVPIQDGWTVVDIGAGLGDFTVYVAKTRPKSRVIGIEPFGESFELLKRNAARNNVSNIVMLQAAVASAPGELVLAQTGAAVQHTTTGSAKQGASDLTHRVQALTLAQIFDAQNVASCDFLKMDCEGGEFDILLNSAPAIFARIRRIAIEYHNGFTAHTHEDLKRHLALHGYSVRTVPNPVHAYLGFLYAERL
jgi:FkbM family methyltransferase